MVELSFLCLADVPANPSQAASMLIARADRLEPDWGVRLEQKREDRIVYPAAVDRLATIPAHMPVLCRSATSQVDGRVQLEIAVAGFERRHFQRPVETMR